MRKKLVKAEALHCRERLVVDRAVQEMTEQICAGDRGEGSGFHSSYCRGKDWEAISAVVLYWEGSHCTKYCCMKWRLRIVVLCWSARRR